MKKGDVIEECQILVHKVNQENNIWKNWIGKLKLIIDEATSIQYVIWINIFCNIIANIVIIFPPSNWAFGFYWIRSMPFFFTFCYDYTNYGCIDYVRGLISLLEETARTEVEQILRDLPPAVLGDDSAQQESRVLIDLSNDVRSAMSEVSAYMTVLSYNCIAWFHIVLVRVRAPRKKTFLNFSKKLAM